MCFRMEDPNRLLTVFSLSKHQWYRKKRNINTSETYCCHTSNGSIIICRYNQDQKKNCSFFPELTDCYLRNWQVAYQMKLFTVFWIPFLSQLEPILMSLLSMSTFLEKKNRFRKLHLQYYEQIYPNENGYYHNVWRHYLNNPIWKLPFIMLQKLYL